MSQMPEGAQLSDDGQWWWDGDQWQAVPEGGAGAGTDERGAARVELGLPAANDDVTAEHLAAFVGEASCDVECGGGDEVEVLAMSESGSGDGEGVA